MSTQLADLFGEFTTDVAGKSPLDLLDNMPSIPVAPKKEPKKRKKKKEKAFIPSYVKHSKLKPRSNFQKRTQLYRINCGTTIYIFVSRKRAKEKALHLDREIQTTTCLNYYLKLKPGFTLKLDGIKPKFVSAAPDGTVMIELNKKKNHNNNHHPISYTPSQLVDRQLQVNDGYIKTINGLSKSTDAIEYILRQLKIRYNALELNRVQAILKEIFPQEFGKDDVVEVYNHIYVQQARIIRIKERRKQYYK